MRESLIAASDWPVFEGYEIFSNANGHPSIGPAEGAAIRDRVDLMNPTVARAALEAAMRIPARAGRPKKYPGMNDLSTSQQTGLTHQLKLLGRVNEKALLEYASRFGLLGIGPSRLVRAVQRFDKDPLWTVTTDRVAGRLVSLRDRRLMNGELHDPELLGVSLVMAGLERPSWSRYNRAVSESEVLGLAPDSDEWKTGLVQADAFRFFEIGSDEWWSLYVEPLDEIPSALYDLYYNLEARLEDTFIDLSTAIGRKYIDRGKVGWRSVSAIGALALMALQGGLEGWSICEYELCGRPFRASEKAGRRQRFCSPSCRSSKHDRDARKAQKVSTGEANGDGR